jgi:hypothetical protein
MYIYIYIYIYIHTHTHAYIHTRGIALRDLWRLDAESKVEAKEYRLQLVGKNATNFDKDKFIEIASEGFGNEGCPSRATYDLARMEVIVRMPMYAHACMCVCVCVCVCMLCAAAHELTRMEVIPQVRIT